MKLCFYNLTAGFKTGGLETYCWEVGRALVNQGHEVHIIGGMGGQPRNQEVQLIALPYTPRERFPNFGTRFRKLAERLSFARHARPLLLRGGYDAIIVNKPYDFPALRWLRQHGFTGVTALRSGGTDFYWGDRYFARAVDVWLSTSAYNARQVETRYHRQVSLIPNGVDPDTFAPRAKNLALRQQLGIPGDAQVVISVGRLVGWKGLHTLIQTLPELPHLHYLAVGKGEARTQLEALAQQLGVASRVHFAGEVAHNQLPEYFNAADCFAQPSIGEEAFGISVAEAMSCGLPVLASDQGGLREVVAPSRTGLLLPPGASAAWVEALGELLDPKRRQAMGEAARQRVLAHYTWAGNASKLLAHLQQAQG
ncbi:glycosyltransferase family 4 protein [Azovibrio restrictus]|uniref:glycosyltransferase family 4 protein n=1 Tax=Azovibrio restrictus TaxID=146938 RepID=UPI0026F37B30|nr:glycosyltransferase family 4 protein [Azovibrio restrictus]MDD3483739.1 glycosyltransferase family 4 protein [Azovibrio restrictus]